MAHPKEYSQSYLTLRGHIVNEFYKLRYDQNTFWLNRDEMVWDKISENEISDDIVKLSHESDDFMDKPTTVQVNDVLRNLRAICKKPGSKPGFFFQDAPTDVNTFIPFLNGVIGINYCRTSPITYRFMPHSKFLFNTYLLPYNYRPIATCETFFNLLNEMFTKEEQELLQEWFGYHLLPENPAQKMGLFIGLGGNGKGVILLLLKLLIGIKNTSHVPLTGFNDKDRFSLSATHEKKANIVEEINFKKTIQTARLKLYVGGGRFTYEVKFKPSFEDTPTAKWSIACNGLPPFDDHTDGIMRRIILIFFKKQFLDESLQRKEYIDENFWIESGELSGIFNWALEGVIKLSMKNWKFTTPPTSQAVLKDLRASLNPAETFLKDYVQQDTPTSFISTAELITNYSRFCKIYGYKSETGEVFGRCVRKVFPQAMQSENPLHTPLGRYRVWYGLSFISSKIQNNDASIEQVPTQIDSIINTPLKEDFCATEFKTIATKEIYE